MGKITLALGKLYHHWRWLLAKDGQLVYDLICSLHILFVHAELDIDRNKCFAHEGWIGNKHGKTWQFLQVVPLSRLCVLSYLVDFIHNVIEYHHFGVYLQPSEFYSILLTIDRTSNICIHANNKKVYRLYWHFILNNMNNNMNNVIMFFFFIGTKQLDLSRNAGTPKHNGHQLLTSSYTLSSFSGTALYWTTAVTELFQKDSPQASK